MKKAYIGIGSNLGNRFGNIAKALALLARHPRIRLEKISPLYWSAPLGVKLQPEFLNGVVRIKTSETPRQLLRTLHWVESRLGRLRTGKDLPRTVDLDILEYDRAEICQPDLIVPHPRMTQRKFVLQPLADLSPAKARKALAAPRVSSQRVVKARGLELAV